MNWDNGYKKVIKNSETKLGEGILKMKKEKLEKQTLLSSKPKMNFS